MHKEMKMSEEYPYLREFSKTTGIPEDKLIQAFKVEKQFHREIMVEDNPVRRMELYNDVYRNVHNIYNKKPVSSGYNSLHTNPMDKLTRLFKKELINKSILDVGCGQGHFLLSIKNNFNYKRLVGLDISIPVLPENITGIEFIQANIVNFETDEKFDVIFSNQVMEHIAKSDLACHLNAVHRSLNVGGIFIISMPNKLFGPSDVTRIIDLTYTGRTEAQGTHLNESTYMEMIKTLKDYGFYNFKTVFPFHYIRYWFSWLRLSPSILIYIERSKILLNLLRLVRIRSSCIARFDVVLICQRE